MGDTVEGLKAVRAHDKEQRRNSWERRGDAIKQIEAAGFSPRALGADEQHFRITLGDGDHVDFWPSTWRWHHRVGGERVPRRRGSGLAEMLAYLKSHQG